MSINEKKRNATFYYFPPEIKIKNNLYKNQNISTISRMIKPATIYCPQVDDYIWTAVFKETKKTQYKSTIDLENTGNKNIFTENTKVNNIKSNLKNKIKKTFEKNKKYTNITSSIHHKDEGKNLLIEKTEIQYPLKSEKNKYILNSKNKFYKINNNLENYNIIPNSMERNYLNHDKNRTKTNIYSNHTPIYNERRYINEKHNYQSRTLILSSLINNCNNLTKKSRNNKFSKYSTDKINDSNNSINRESFSPIIPPYHSSTNKSIHNTQNRKKINNIMNSNDFKNDDTILRNTCNFIYSNHIDKNKYFLINNENDYTDDKDINDNKEEKEIILNMNDNDDDIKLISLYRKKLLSLFLVHMKNFYKIYLKKIFNDFILKLKKTISNKKSILKNKEIINKKEIKKKKISNSFNNGHIKQNINLQRKIKNNHYLIINNQNNNKINITYNKLYLGNDNIQLKKKFNINQNRKNIIKKNYILNSNSIINKKIEDEIKNKEKKDSFSNKKYIKKSITKKIFRKFKQNNCNINSEKNNININNLNENSNLEKRKIIKSFDKISIMNKTINATRTSKNNIFIPNKKNTIIIENNNKKISHPFKKVILNSSNINNKTIQNNKFNNDYKLKNNKINDECDKYKVNNKKNNELEIHEIIKVKSLDEKLNMNIKYFDKRNKSISSNSKRNERNKIFKIENTFVHTFLGKEINNNNLKENCNNNLENAILFSKKDEKSKNIRYNFLFEIIQKKIKKEKKQNLEVVNKYFNKMKAHNILINNKISNENTKENLFLRNSDDRKLHKSFTMNILIPYMEKIRPRKSYNSNLFLKNDINNIHSKNLLKKTISEKIINKNFNKNIFREINKKKKDTKEIEVNKYKKDNNIESVNEIRKENMDKKSKSEKNLINNYNNFQIFKKEDIKQDRRKSFEKDPKFLYKTLIEMKTKYKEKYSKLNKISDKAIINEGDITLDEKYQDYETLIYYFRNQLILCFIRNNNNNSYND